MSARFVDTHADEVKTKHVAADGRVEGALAGLPAGAAAALSTKMTAWQSDTAHLFERMVEHADALRAGAAAYTKTDDDSGISLAAAAQRVAELHLGL